MINNEVRFESEVVTPSAGQEAILTPTEIKMLTEQYRQKFAPHIPLDHPGLAQAAILYSQTETKISHE